MDPTVLLKALLFDEARDPYPYYAELHEHGQVCRLDPPVDGYDLVVHGYEAVDRVLRDPAFRRADADRPDLDKEHGREHPVLRTLRESLLFIDAPAHTRIRRLFSQVLTARRVTALEPAIVRSAGDLLDRMADLGAGGGPVEFMSEFAFPFPCKVIGELLGVPEEDRAWLRPRVLAIGAIFEEGGRTGRTMRAADAAAVELTDYFSALVAKRRGRPREDLISGLLRAQATGAEQLSETELLANLITLLDAAFATTAHLFGNGLAQLLERPAELDRLRANPELAGSYVEEMLRFDTSTRFVVRYTPVDTELMGVPVPAGSTVLVLLAAANRDPRRFDRPDAFDPARPDNRSLVFGAGPHVCPGAVLARAAGRLAFPMLLQRFPRLALAGPLPEPRKLTFRGYDTMPVLLT
jgi:cytochrome P450